MDSKIVRSGLFRILLTYLVLAGIELAFHWFIGTSNSPLARWLASLYFCKAAHGREHVAFAISWVLPGITLGMAAGNFGVSWSLRRFAACVLVLPLGVIALYAAYASFFANGRWWTEQRINPEDLSRWVIGYVNTLILCGAVAIGARVGKAKALRFGDLARGSKLSDKDSS
jgi:hypothetical protein